MVSAGRARLHVTGHEAAARQLPEPAVERVRLGLPHQGHDVAGHDVEPAVEAGHRLADVLGLDADPLAGRDVGALLRRRGRRHVRIGPPGQVVHQRRNAEQDDRVDADRPQRERVALLRDRGTPDRREQRARTARRVDAAQRHHHGDRDGDSHRGGDRHVVEHAGRRDADRGGDDVAHQQRVRLGERAGRSGEQQDGAGSHRRDDERQHRRPAGDGLRGETRQGDADEGAEPATQEFRPPIAHGPRAERRHPRPAVRVQPDPPPWDAVVGGTLRGRDGLGRAPRERVADGSPVGVGGTPFH